MNVTKQMLGIAYFYSKQTRRNKKNQLDRNVSGIRVNEMKT